MDYMAMIAAEQAKIEQLGRAVHQMQLDKAGLLASVAQETGEPVPRLNIGTRDMVEQNPSHFTVRSM